MISGYYAAKAGHDDARRDTLPPGMPALRASRGIARTFQTPRVIGEASVLQNVMIGGTIEGRATFVEAAAGAAAQPARRAHACAPRPARCSASSDWKRWPTSAPTDCSTANCASSRSRAALMLEPDFLLLDEPAAGLSSDEIERLAALIKAISRRGTGVLLVEHHADLIFDICDQVTVLNLGRTLAAGTPAEIRVHKEVVSAYLGA